MAKTPRPPVKLPDAHKLFMHAEGFRMTTELLRGKVHEWLLIYHTAFHANSAFCCELYLKCLRAIRAREHDRGHKLDLLFESLPAQDQDRVEYHYERLSQGDIAHIRDGNASPSKSNALRDFLKDGADVFESIRYWYAGNFKDARGDFHYPILALREAILEIHPRWRMQSENWLKPTREKR